ncbi:hypothetical protein A1O1_07835 [Capronia coronata CBS 617.96]|uniref:Stress-response A/B barrel domain-containing protein n=1 Tax=Capronia coronata CBS 617.96 TaxID=1182541 RepID=W9XWN1_9EURO|nr:uncharacterized protein A1O1_07835 [Capronia coronata CBS 617.96]EXJ81770.1 hypothetical protein A1O1_07835 [Capronia coronata CBS 617.96]
MSIVHIVLFKLKSSLSDAEKKEFCDDMLSLKGTCMHPASNKPYIVSSSGGVDNSPEGAQVGLFLSSMGPHHNHMQGGFTHGFVVEFASKEDRDYYVSQDPAHQAFVKKNSLRFEDARVLDYEKGVY